VGGVASCNLLMNTFNEIKRPSQLRPRAPVTDTIDTMVLPLAGGRVLPLLTYPPRGGTLRLMTCMALLREGGGGGLDARLQFHGRAFPN